MTGKLFTTYELDKEEAEIIARELLKHCDYTKTEIEYLECCNKNVSECTIETKPDFEAIAARNAENQKEAYIALSFIIIIFIIAFLLIYLFIKKGYYKKYKKDILYNTKLIVSGWLTWALCIFSYNKLFQEDLAYETWLTLPALCVITIYLWVKKFVAK